MRPRFATIACLLVATAAVVGSFSFSGSKPRKEIIDTLKSPVQVVGWSQSGLELSDGRVIGLPELSELPATSVALSEATKRGVEIGDDGRVYGLVPIHHWCGNDSVRKHIARVDLSHLLEFLQEGEAGVTTVPEVSVSDRPQGKFSEFGWDVGEYFKFEAWCSLKIVQG